MFGATQPTSLRLSLGTGNAEMLGESTLDVTKPVPQSWHRGKPGEAVAVLVCWACWSQFFCNLECSGWIWCCPRSSRKTCCFGLKRASCQLIFATFDVKDVKMKAFQCGWPLILSPGNGGRWWRKELTFKSLWEREMMTKRCRFLKQCLNVSSRTRTHPSYSF